MLTPAHNANLHQPNVANPNGPTRIPPLDGGSAMSILERAAKHSTQSVIIFDSQGVCGWVNQATYRSFGLDESTSLVGRLNLHEHCLAPDETQPGALERVFRGESIDLPALHYDLRGLAPAGSGNVKMGVPATLLPLVDEYSGVIAVYVFNYLEAPEPGTRAGTGAGPDDVLLRHSIATAKRLSRRTAHDFNNIIAVMQGYASILNNRLEHDPENQELASLIEVSGTDALHLTGLMANFASEKPVNPEELDLNSVVLRFIAEQRGSFPEGVEVSTDLADSIHLMEGDESRLAAVCQHLWENAIEAMPQGGDVSWQTSEHWLPSPERTANEERYVRLRVSDTGVGMNQQTRGMMFEPFFTTKTGKDRGLGATLVYETVKAHRGFLEVSSAEDAGTCVDLFFPALPSLPDQEASQQD